VIDLRRERTGDEAAMTTIFVSSRRQAMTAAGLPAPIVESLLAQQSAIQRDMYRTARPGAAWEAIVDGEAVVGRLITDTTPDAIDLVDIVVAPSRQRTGVGSQVLATVLDRADSAALPVRLRVDHASPAEQWYRRHGFEPAGSDALQMHLIRLPRALASAATEGNRKGNHG
jgi:GNAT superfamily N-acetyltransferase